MADPTTRALLADALATRLALMRIDMIQLQSQFAAAMPGKLESLERRLGIWADGCMDAARLLREVSKEVEHG